MIHLPPLIQDLAVILGVAAIVTFIFVRIRQPVVLGYIIAGVIVGPYTPEIFSVTDTENIKVWAELGVIFLMFSLGLEFSFRRLARVGVSAIGTGVLQILFMLTAGVVVGNFLSWSKMESLFLGCMIAISSTTIIIKALNELKFTDAKFSELVFGILIVEDLAAILMLAALTSIATTSEFAGADLLIAGLKLGIVVAVWFLVGMFLVPRLVKSVGKHGNDEMLTVVATGLCLALVSLAASLHYSVALGAFIMGSIIAESAEVKRIEHLVQPIRDIFGAVFFVSVGMLLNPSVVLSHWFEVLIISLVIVFGKLISVQVGAFLTGQSLRTSTQTAFSMAQIGEFSFIIATLGIAYKAIDEAIYPTIVAASLITTFTTPYLIKLSPKFVDIMDSKMSPFLKEMLTSYTAWIQRRTLSNDRRTAFARSAMKWSLNAVVVIAVFTISFKHLVPVLAGVIHSRRLATIATWVVAFVASSPSLWAMITAFGRETRLKERRELLSGTFRILGGIVTVGLLGLVSLEYFPALETLSVTLGICIVLLVLFRRTIGMYYRWLELQFQSGFRADLGVMKQKPVHDRLAPWDARLVEVKLPHSSSFVGKSLGDLGIREKYGLSVVVISREGRDVVAPKPQDILFPNDILMCFATDQEIQTLKNDLEVDAAKNASQNQSEHYEVRKFKIAIHSPLDQTSIRHSAIREKFDCIVVGIERNGVKNRNPNSDEQLRHGDLLWIVGDTRKFKELSTLFEGSR